MKRDRRPYPRKLRPFWLPASNFYFLSAAIAMGVFFLVWSVLNDGRDESPWITAGLVSSLVLISAVVLREVVLRNLRHKIFTAQRKLDNSLLSAPIPIKNDAIEEKLTLEKNAELLSDIKRKSDAAKVLSRIADSHREVFELCEAYLVVAKRELPYVGVGSPRIAAITKGRDKAEGYHRYHMLKWAEIEARSHTRSVSEKERVSLKLDRATKALAVVETALNYYPNEVNLRDSENVLRELIVSLRVSGWIERAERAAFKGNHARAISHYQDALFFLEREAAGNEQHNELKTRLTDELEKLRHLVRE
jgi:tetratricopeptide (TPR) repeat protein